MNKITSKDHFLSGSMKSKVKVLTYTDLECPFCKSFNTTTQDLIDVYGNKVAFVLRHYPLSFHSNAQLAANASECAAKVGGKKKFASFINETFNISPNLSLDTLSDIAVDLGIKKNSFDTCLAQYAQQNEVDKDIKSAASIVQSGNFGTPYSLVYGPNNTVMTILGNQSYSVIKEMLDTLVK